MSHADIKQGSRYGKEGCKEWGKGALNGIADCGLTGIIYSLKCITVQDVFH
jgi:hypothetical protein